MLRKLGFWTLLIALVAAGGRLASAQTTANISGTVKDATAGVLPGVDIVVKNVDTGVTRSTVTDEQGRYRVTNLNIGQYEVTASLAGFQTEVRGGIGLTIGREAVIDVTLRVGDLTESVKVTGDAPLVETRSGSLGGIVDRGTILEIPLNGRDLTGLITMQAGTAMATTTSSGASQGYSRKFSIGGARVGDNAVLLDGTDVRSMDQGVPAGVSGNFLGGEAIQEFKVERNSYSAEYGGAAGGVINVVSKSGANDFHGSGYGFTRNDVLDAINFRAPALTDSTGKYIGKAKPSFWRAQYGASAGGHIVPNRMFYFGNFEGLRERLEYTTYVTTLGASARKGILPGRTVTVNPAVVPYLSLYPLPANAIELPDGTARYGAILSQPTNEDFYQGRIDHNFSESNSLFGRFTRQISNRTSPQPIDIWSGNSRVFNTFLTVEEKKVFTSRLLSTFRFGFNRRGIAEFSTEKSGAVDPSLYLVPTDHWLAPMGAPPIMGSLLVTGLSDIGLGRGWVDRATNRFQFTDAWVYAAGSRTWKFGVDVTHMLMGGANPSRPGGELTFGSVEALLLGRPRQFRGDILPQTDFMRHLKWDTFGWYMQYDWQFSSRASLNAGLRHEWFTVPTERDGKYANLKDPWTDTTVTIMGTRGEPWWHNTSYTNFSPRLGLSWDPTGSGKMAIRAGAGLFYNLLQPETFRQFAWRTAPFGLETIYQAPEGQIPFPKGLYDFIVGLGAQQGSMFVFPWEPKNARMLQWNVNVQRELFSNTAVTIGYAGSRGYDLVNQVYTNVARATMVDGRYTFPTTARRPNAAFNQDLAGPFNMGASWYQSLQVELQRRFQKGWQAQVAYTLARSIDLGSQFTPTFDGSSGGSSIYTWNQNLGKGLSAFNMAQRLSGNVVWEVPGGGGKGLASTILGGWQLSAIFNFAAGLPSTISIGAQSALTALGIGNQGSAPTPDLIAGGNNNPVLGGPDKYFDTSQFAMPPARTLGNVARNTLVGPGIATIDVGLTRNITVGKEKRVQFRGEIFNLLNRANFGQPNSLVFDAAGRRNASAGFISATSTTARQIQLGLRLEW